MEKTTDFKKFEYKLAVDKGQTPFPVENLKKTLPTIKCICGAEILVISDLKAMSTAIRNHLFEHRRAEKDQKKAAVEWALAEQFFIEQLFDYASNMEEEWQLV